MKLRVIDPARGIVKISISELARAGRERKNGDMLPPPLWTPPLEQPERDNRVRIPPPPDHDPEGRNRR